MSTATLDAPCSRKRELHREHAELTDKIETDEALASAHARKRDMLKAKAARLTAEAEAEDALYDQFSDRANIYIDRQFEIDDLLEKMEANNV